MDRDNKAYQDVLEHRRNCKKWGKGFCLDCFGGGLNLFKDKFDEEERKELGLPSIEKMIIDRLGVDSMIWASRARKERAGMGSMGMDINKYANSSGDEK